MRKRGRAGVAVTVALAISLIAPAAGSAAPSWHSGAIQESAITNCYSIINGSPYVEAGAATYMSAYYDDASPPPAGQSYYLDVTVFGLGNACAGQLADIEVGLPQGTQPAISVQNPVACRELSLNNAGTAIVASAPDQSGACPQNPGVGPHGGYSFDMAQNSGWAQSQYFPFWPVPQTYGVEIEFPVVSASHLGSTNATGVVTVADGNAGPTLLPTVTLPVAGSIAATHTAGTPSVTSPAVTNITDHSARVQALVVNNYTDGTIDLNYDTDGPPYLQSLGITDVASARTYQVSRATTLTGLQPGCTYHWNVDLRYFSGGGYVYAQLPDQTFKTTGVSTGSCAIDSSAPPATGGNTSFLYGGAPNAHGTSTSTLGTGGTTPPVTLTIPKKDPPPGTTPPSGSDPGTGTSNPDPGGGPDGGGGGPVPPPPAFTALAVPAVQHGKVLKLKLTVGSPGSLVAVGLLERVTKKHKTRQVLVGKLSRSGVSAGPHQLTVPLNSLGKKLLRAHGHLKLTLKLAVTPPGGAAVSATRTVSLKR